MDSHIRGKTITRKVWFIKSQYLLNLKGFVLGYSTFASDEKQKFHSKFIVYCYNDGSYFVAIPAFVPSFGKIYYRKTLPS